VTRQRKSAQAVSEPSRHAQRVPPRSRSKPPTPTHEESGSDDTDEGKNHYTIKLAIDELRSLKGRDNPFNAFASPRLPDIGGGKRRRKKPASAPSGRKPGRPGATSRHPSHRSRPSRTRRRETRGAKERGARGTADVHQRRSRSSTTRTLPSQSSNPDQRAPAPASAPHKVIHHKRSSRSKGGRRTEAPTTPTVPPRGTETPSTPAPPAVPAASPNAALAEVDAIAQRVKAHAMHRASSRARIVSTSAVGEGGATAEAASAGSQAAEGSGGGGSDATTTVRVFS